jgi:epoxyqueuosine reductase
MLDSLTAGLESLGFHARAVSALRLGDLRRRLEDQYARGLLDEGFFSERLARMTSSAQEELPGAKTLIVLAYRDRHVRFTFTWAGEQVPVIVPATYLHFYEKDMLAKQALEAVLVREGYSVAEATVPKKLLAVQSGLARYGRNNITYITGMGSLYRLAAFFSDLPGGEDEWGEPLALERCRDCMACIRACPTGAIGEDRFLLRAERCVSFWNEKPGQVAFPEWFDASWHNCLVGCLTCQSVCPENREVVGLFDEGEDFSEEETGLLLEGRETDRLPSALVAKLERADLLASLDTLPRNLGVLVHRKRR